LSQKFKVSLSKFSSIPTVRGVVVLND